MAINDVAGGRVYHVVRDIPREFLDHNFVSGLCSLEAPEAEKEITNIL